MAVYPLSFPGFAITSEKLTIAFQQANMESPHTLAQQTIQKADHWLLEFNWPRMTHADADSIQAWLDRLAGQLGSFTYSPRNAVRYNLPNRTLALAAFSYSNTVSIGGWAANADSGLRGGNYVQIGPRLHRVVAGPSNADANGRCVVEVQPQIRQSLPVGTAVKFNNPKGTFRLSSSDGYGYSLDTDRAPSFPTIQAKEAL